MNPRKGTVTYCAVLDGCEYELGSGGNESSEGDCDLLSPSNDSDDEGNVRWE